MLMRVAIVETLDTRLQILQRCAYRAGISAPVVLGFTTAMRRPEPVSNITRSEEGSAAMTLSASVQRPLPAIAVLHGQR